MYMFLLNMLATKAAVHLVWSCYPKHYVSCLFPVVLFFPLSSQTEPQSVPAVILLTVPF